MRKKHATYNEKSKIHTATITGLELYYEGSVTIDQELDQANIFEQVQTVNPTTANDLCYTISGERNSGVIELNDQQRLAAIGDRIIITPYGIIDDQEAPPFNPVFFFNDQTAQPNRYELLL